MLRPGCAVQAAIASAGLEEERLRLSIIKSGGVT